MILIKKTLADAVLKDFSKIKLKKASVKVPELRVRKINTVKPKKNDSVPISSIINILIKSAVERAKKEKKQKQQAEEGKSYKILKNERELIVSGGYGTISKGYGAAPHTAYVDYGKLFGYLGSFRAKQPYENMAEHLGTLNKSTERSSFILAGRDAMDKIGRYEKYIKTPAMDMPIMALSLVPIAGLSSGEWEEIKMLMKLDPVLYALKTKTA